MFNEKLFFELCEKYGVELVERYGKAKIYRNGEPEDLLEVDVTQIFYGQSFDSPKLTFSDSFASFTLEQYPIAC